MQRSLSDLNRQWRRWMMLLLVSVLLLSCCAVTGVFGWLIAPMTTFMANRMTTVQGRIEVVIPAQWSPGGASLSTDGRYMVQTWTRNGHFERFIWDMMTDQRRALALNLGSDCWLNEKQILMGDNRHYTVVEATSLKIVPVTIMPSNENTQSGWQESLLSQWQQAEQIYLLSDFGGFSGSIVLTFKDGQSMIYNPGKTTGENAAIADLLIRTLPQVHHDQLCNNLHEHDPHSSPDGRFTAQLSRGLNELTIHNQEGSAVAYATKTGWDMRLIGWAYDSSGVYFQTSIKGEAAGMMVPYRPLFKLSPLTPEEERAQWWWNVGDWAAGCVAVVGVVGSVVWRRQKRRVMSDE